MAKVLAAAAVFLVVMSLSWSGISAQTHHVVGDDRGWSPDLDVGSWLSGRIFSVGDKIWFKQSGTEDSIVEVEGLDEFISCNLTNPIRMYTDPVTHFALDKEGVRYFTSGNVHHCNNGLKLPVTVKASPDPKPTPPYEPFTPPYEPFTPDEPEPEPKPSPPYGLPPPYEPFTPDEPEPKPSPPYGPRTSPPPYEPFTPDEPKPSPPYGPPPPPYEPFTPDEPEPEPKPSPPYGPRPPPPPEPKPSPPYGPHTPPPPPYEPSTAIHMKGYGLSFVSSVVLMFI